MSTETLKSTSKIDCKSTEVFEIEMRIVPGAPTEKVLYGGGENVTRRHRERIARFEAMLVEQQQTKKQRRSRPVLRTFIS